MLDVFPLPLIWIVAFALGEVLRRQPANTHRWGAVCISVAALFLGCGVWDGGFYIALGGSILLFGKLIERLDGSRRKLAFIVAVLYSCGMIFLFLLLRNYVLKYFLYLPSLSYLGFRGIAYLTSVYRREPVTLSAATLQIFFFPMLFTGPISRVNNFDETRTDYPQVLRRLIAGLAMLTAGFLLKPYIVPQYILLRGSAAFIPASQLWISMLATSFELYFTFAGYSHIIIGLGLVLGFQLPENFNNPYIATSITDFWRRWHISLSFWIRDHVYIPLGGNRYGLLRKCVNLMTAMSICGVWHGLSLNFLLWGMYHGGLLCCESICRHYRFEPLSVLPDSIARVIRIMITFSLVTFGWLLFFYSVPALRVFLKGMLF